MKPITGTSVPTYHSQPTTKYGDVFALAVAHNVMAIKKVRAPRSRSTETPSGSQG
jgi:hypothetical protein